MNGVREHEFGQIGERALGKEFAHTSARCALDPAIDCRACFFRVSLDGQAIRACPEVRNRLRVRRTQSSVIVGPPLLSVQMCPHLAPCRARRTASTAPDSSCPAPDRGAAVVVVDFEDPREAWKALGDGYRVEVRIVVWEGADVLKAPIGALFRLRRTRPRGKVG